MSDVLRKKLAVLSDAAKYDASCASSGSQRKGKAGGLGNTNKVGICHSYTPDGRCVSLLKILLTNHCIYDCQYCINRVTSNVERARFTVDEVVKLTIEFYKRNYIEGLFLSSGIIQSVDYTMQQLVDVAKTLRTREGYNGYIHLKAIPGASQELIDEAGLWADRLSANIELPTQADLDRFAPEKKVADVENTMSIAAGRIAEYQAERQKTAKAPRFAPAGQSTQLIVGASPSSDTSILASATHLYRTHKLKRVYYSAFSPIPDGDARLPVIAAPLMREHRLYQADWLIRFYGFQASELTTIDQPNLDLKIDPKLTWALRFRNLFPVDINKASLNKLLRVPGIGKRNAERIIQARRFHSLRLADLAKLRVPMEKVRPWVTTSDYKPDLKLLDRLDLKQRVTRNTEQMDLFAAPVSALTGEV
ncbi:MAG TPA: putative DNA modification/repair radical SAM protein [Tepidisphaeraceae bacterium]|jgi:putative DNA modification/repair radical SAM protein